MFKPRSLRSSESIGHNEYLNAKETKEVQQSEPLWSMILPLPGDGKQMTLNMIMTTDVWELLHQQYDQMEMHIDARHLATMLGEICSNHIRLDDDLAKS